MGGVRDEVCGLNWNGWRILGICEEWDGKQLLRSGTSVGANYREACRARSDAEFIAILGICLKELEETVYWLELLGESDIVRQSILSPLLDETDQLLAIFTSIVKAKKQNIRNT